MEAYPKAVMDDDPGFRTLAASGCISECVHKETIVYYSFADPIDRPLVESLGQIADVYVDEATGIFKVARLDHFYIFGVLGERELRICMFYIDKLSDRLQIDRRLIEHFKARGAVSCRFNKSGSLARIAAPVGVPESALAGVH